MIRKGIRNGSTYWYCKECGRYFSGRRKVSQEVIHAYYKRGVYTVEQIAQHLGISASTVKRSLRTYQAEKPELTPKQVVLQIDTTYWGRNFGVVLFMDAQTHRILHYRFIHRRERVEDYRIGVSCLQKQGVEILGIVSDGLQGVREAFAGIPFQYCQFHQRQRIRQLLTNNPRLEASRALKEVVSKLNRTGKEVFAEALAQWLTQWRDFMNEKTELPNGKRCFTHNRLRSAFFSLRRHLDILFTYECFPELNIPKTNNALEALNAVLKTKLRLHRGISIKRREALIASIITAHNPIKENR